MTNLKPCPPISGTKNTPPQSSFTNLAFLPFSVTVQALLSLSLRYYYHSAGFELLHKDLRQGSSAGCHTYPVIRCFLFTSKRVIPPDKLHIIISCSFQVSTSSAMTAALSQPVSISSTFRPLSGSSRLHMKATMCGADIVCPWPMGNGMSTYALPM